MTIPIDDLSLPPWLKALYLAAQALAVLCGTALNAGIIYYENNVADVRRTLLNKMIAVVALYSLAGPLVLTPFMAARAVAGPRSAAFCEASVLLYSAHMLLLVMAHVETMLLRFLYACVFRTVGALNEDFFRYFFLVYNAAAAAVFLAGSYGVHASARAGAFCYCVGVPVGEHCPQEGAVKGSTVMVGTLLLTYVVFPLLILIKKSEPGSSSSKSAYAVVGVWTSVVGVAGILVLLLPGNAVMTLINHGGEREEGATDYYWLLTACGLGYNLLVSVVVPFFYYCRSRQLRQFALRGLREFFGREEGSSIAVNG